MIRYFCLRRSSLRSAAPVAALLLAACFGLPRVLPGQPLQRGREELEAPLEKFEPRQPRSEREQDELYAAGEYALGRMLLQRDDLPGALRRLQRAFRYNPNAPSIARDIVAVATTLNRHAEAVRYAVLAAERETPKNPELLRQLGEYVAELGEYERAAALYEKGIELMKQQAAPLSGLVLLQAETGRLYLALKKYDRAADLLAGLGRALEQPEQYGFEGDAKTKLLAERARLLPLVAESQLRTGDLDGARETYRRAYEAQPNEPLLTFQLARIAVEQRDWPAARQQLASYFQAQSAAAGAEAYELLAEIIRGEGAGGADALQRVVDELAGLHEKDPQNVPLGYYLSDRLIAAGQSERAAKLLEEMVRLEPRPAAYRELAKIYHQQQDAKALAGLLERAFAGERGIDLLDADGRKIAGDAPFFQQLVAELRPRSADAAAGEGAAARCGGCLAAALLAINAGDLKLVEELYEQALASAGDAKTRIYETLGLALLRSDQFSLCAKVFADAIAANPRPAKAAAYHYYRAAALAFADDTPGAIVAAEKSVELAPDMVQFQSRAAWVLYHAKRWQESERRYCDVLEKLDGQFGDEDVREQVRQIRMALSNICVMEGRMPEAEEWLEQVLDEFPEDIGAHNDLGYLWADQGKHLERALAMCQKAVAAEPDNGAYRDSLGWAFFRLNRYAEAIEELEAAARLTPDGVILEHLGDAYLAAKQTEKAVAAWERAVEVFETENDQDRLKQVRSKIQPYRSP